ncbi:MAG: C1 family peptidase [Flavobacteriales bacterium]
MNGASIGTALKWFDQLLQFVNGSGPILILSLFFVAPDWATAQGGQEHPIDGALLPTRTTLLQIASEKWTGLPKSYRLPGHVDLRADLPPPGDQGRQNSCIAWALAYGTKSYLQAKRTGLAPVDTTGRMDPTRTFSPAYPYNLTKKDFDTADVKCLGSHFDRVFSVLVEQGCCTWSDMPYDPDPKGCFQAVPARSSAVALRHTMATPLRVSPWELDQLRFHLAQGTPVSFAMGIDTAFKYGGKRAAVSGVPFSWRPECAAPMPGSHAMLAVGYDDADSSFLIMNSWGTAWGEGGYCRLRYDVFDCHVTEAYVARDPMPAPEEPVVFDEAVDKATSGRRLKAKLSPGSTANVRSLTLGLAQHDPESDRVLLMVRDTSASEGIQMLDLIEDRPVRLFNGDEMVTVTYTKASRTNNVRRIRAHIVAVVEDKGVDPCVERAISQAARIRSARASHP